MPPSPVGQVINLNGDLDRLSREVSAWRAVVVKTTDQAGSSTDEAVQALLRMTELIADIGDQLDEIVPLRVRRRVGRAATALGG